MRFLHSSPHPTLLRAVRMRCVLPWRADVGEALYGRGTYRGLSTDAPVEYKRFLTLPLRLSLSFPTLQSFLLSHLPPLEPAYSFVPPSIDECSRPHLFRRLFRQKQGSPFPSSPPLSLVLLSPSAVTVRDRERLPAYSANGVTDPFIGPQGEISRVWPDLIVAVSCSPALLLLFSFLLVPSPLPTLHFLLEGRDRSVVRKFSAAIALFPLTSCSTSSP